LHRDLTCKLLQLLPARRMLRKIMELLGNRSFTLTSGGNKRSSLQRLKNGVPQGSTMVLLLFNIYLFLADRRLQNSQSMHTLTTQQSCMLMETSKQWK